MRLAEFIRAHREDILKEWSATVRTLPVARDMSRPALRDHVPELLSRLADSLGEAHLVRAGDMVPIVDLAIVHAMARLVEGFDLRQVAAEYGLLRTCVLRRWATLSTSSEALHEALILDQTIDRALGVAVDRYAQARERTLAALDRIATAALGSPDAGAFLQSLMRALLESVPAVETVAVLLLEADEALHVRAAVGLDAEVREGFAIRLGDGFAGSIGATRTPRLLRGDEIVDLVRSETLRALDLQCLYGVPLMHGDQLIGVAHIGSRTVSDFSDEDKILFQTMAQRATAMLAQKRTEEALRRAVEERDATLAELRASEARFRSVVDTMPLLAWYAEPDGHIGWYNRRWYEYTGTTLPEQEGWRWESVHDPDDVERVKAKWRAALESGEPWEDEFRLRGADGTYRWFLSRAAPLRDESGKITRWFGTNVDVDDQKRAADAMTREAAFRERFVSILGHDLRNPLGAISLTAQTLLRNKSTNGTTEQALRRIMSATRRMERMVSDLLDFARMRQGGGIVLAPAPTRLDTICRAVIDEVRAANPDRLIELNCGADCEGMWDPDRIAQVVSNVVGNAVMHSPADAKVRVDVVDCGPDRVSLAIHNEGPAIPAEMLPALFDPYKKGRGTAPNGARREARGLGLGLYITWEIVRAHGGVIRVASEEGDTMFTVELPRRPAETRVAFAS